MGTITTEIGYVRAPLPSVLLFEKVAKDQEQLLLIVERRNNNIAFPLTHISAITGANTFCQGLLREFFLQASPPEGLSKGKSLCIHVRLPVVSTKIRPAQQIARASRILA